MAREKARIITELRIIEISLDSTPSIFPGAGPPRLVVDGVEAYHPVLRGQTVSHIIYDEVQEMSDVDQP